jgi:hypothetical protein
MHHDPLAVVIDWLDLLKTGHVVELASLYRHDALLDCRCTGAHTAAGQYAIIRYWRSRSDRRHPAAFEISDLRLSGNEVVLDYHDSQGEIIRAEFTIDDAGKITRMSCAPRGVCAPVAPPAP